MKKTYQTPATDIIVVAATQMICGSTVPEHVEEGFNTGDAPETDATSGNLGRRNDIWADEEDEEIY